MATYPTLSGPVTNKYDHTHSLLGIWPFKQASGWENMTKSALTCDGSLGQNKNSFYPPHMRLTIKSVKYAAISIMVGRGAQTYEHEDKWASLDLELEWTTSGDYKYFEPLAIKT